MTRRSIGGHDRSDRSAIVTALRSAVNEENYIERSQMIESKLKWAFFFTHLILIKIQ